MNPSRTAFACASLLAGLMACSAVLAQTPTLPTAEQTDPVKLGWMIGSPPPPDKIIRFADGSFEGASPN
jgi:hypothetical protein